MKQLSLVVVLFGLWIPAFCFGDDYAVTAQEAFSMMEEEADQILFIDVRDPVEIMFIGADSLIQGVGVAKPNSIARAISQPSTITLTF